MNDKLVQLHDGELGDDEATQMRASLTEEAADRALLDAMHRVDRTLVEVDRLIAPRAERVESGKEALKAALRGRASDQRTPGAHFALRRRTIGVVGGALAAAAAITIWVAWPIPGVIGTVQYRGAGTLSSDQPPVAIRLESAVRAPSDGEAHIHVPDVFQAQLSRGGEVRIGRIASDLHWVSGRVALQAFAEVALHLGDAGPHVVTGPNSVFRLLVFENHVEVAQESGTSVVVVGDQRRTVEAGTTIRLDLGESPVSESDGPEQ